MTVLDVVLDSYVTCRPLVECPDCEGAGVVFDHTNYWGKAEDRDCALCGGTGAVDPVRLP